MAQYGALAQKEYAPLAEIIGSRRWGGKVTELSINGPHDIPVRIACSIRIPRPIKADYSMFEIDEAIGQRLDEMVESGKAFLLSGGTGSGKTTLFNILCRKIPAW